MAGSEPAKFGAVIGYVIVFVFGSMCGALFTLHSEKGSEPASTGFEEKAVGDDVWKQMESNANRPRRGAAEVEVEVVGMKPEESSRDSAAAIWDSVGLHGATLPALLSWTLPALIARPSPYAQPCACVCHAHSVAPEAWHAQTGSAHDRQAVVLPFFSRARVCTVCVLVSRSM